MSFKNLNRGLSCAFLACMFVAPAAMAAEKNVVEDNSFASQVKRIKEGVSIFEDDFNGLIGTVAELNGLGEYAKNNSQLLSSGVVSRVLRCVRYGNVHAGNNEIVEECIKEIVRMMVNDVDSQNIGKPVFVGLSKKERKNDNDWGNVPITGVDPYRVQGPNGRLCGKMNGITEKRK